MSSPNDPALENSSPQPASIVDLAHDVRNALAAISYSSMLLQRGAVKSTDAERLYTTIRNQVEIIRKLVDGMVEASPDGQHVVDE